MEKPVHIKITSPVILKKLERLKKDIYSEKTNVRTIEKMIELDYKRMFISK